MILIQKVGSYGDIVKMKTQSAFTNIFECVQIDKGEQIFVKCELSEPSWLDKLRGKDRMDHHYYISSHPLSMLHEMDISHRDTRCKIRLTLELTVQLDMVKSDSGKGLPVWLEKHNVPVDDEAMKAYISEVLEQRAGIFEQKLGLHTCPLAEMLGKKYKADVFRGKVFKDWLAVSCTVTNAVERMTGTMVDRQKALEEERRRQIALEEAERRHQEALDEAEWEKERVQADIEIQKRKNELAALKNQEHTSENQSRMDMLRTVCDDLRQTQIDNAVVVEGSPCQADRMILEINGIQLELYAKRNVTFGRSESVSDVSVQIPDGCNVEPKTNRYISNEHARLERLGGEVRIMSLPRTPTAHNSSCMTSTYLNGKVLPSEGRTFSEDAEIGFSSMVRWKARVQKNRSGNVSAMSLNYAGWTALYKVFVWPCCELKAVDSRLPDWRILYQSGAHGSVGTFYVQTARKRFYLAPELSVVEGVPLSVRL